MNWWKAHHGIATDLKYAVVLRHIQKSNALRDVTNGQHNTCPVTRSDIVSVWVWLIDFSSQNSPRGSIDGIEIDEIAASLDLPDDSVEVIINALRWKGMITGNVLTAFEKRQPMNDKTNAERQARHRARLKQQESDSNALRNGTNALALAREDEDEDGDGEVLVVNDLLLTTEVLSVGRDEDGTDRPTENARFESMKAALAGYMHPGKPPDGAIVRRCLAAINGTDMYTVQEFLRDRYVNREQSPRHPNGPRKYGWFVTVLAEQFGGHK